MRGDGWQVIQSLYAIGSGGLFGAGLGESKQKYLYIPEPHLSASIVIIGIISIMMIVAGCKFWHFLVTGRCV